MNIDEIIFLAAHNEEPRIFINDILSEEPSFEFIIGYLKTFSKSIKGDENMSLKKQVFNWWMDLNGIESIQTGYIACAK